MENLKSPSHKIETIKTPTDMLDTTKINSAIPVITGTATAMVYSFDVNRALDTIIYTTIGALTSILIAYLAKRINKWSNS